MKKFFAILIVAILATSFAFGQGTWTAPSATGTFTAVVFCTPVLTDPSSTTIDIGDFFPGNSYSGTSSLTWTLTGPTEGNYDISVTGDKGTSDATWDFTGYTFDDTGTVLGIACSTPVNLTGTLNGVDFTGATPGTHTYTVTVAVTVTL